VRRQEVRRKKQLKMKPIHCLLAGLALLAISNLAHPATITWTNTSGSNWSVAAN
jgi:hypothetical protein